MSWAEVVVAVTALASAVIGGALFAFSTFVMKSLGRLAPPEGIRAMQRLNEDAPQGLLLPLLLSPLGSLVAAVLAVTGKGLGDTVLVDHRTQLAVGALLGVAAFLVTAVANIPRNNALAALDADAASAAGEWAAYRRSWTAWNHVRVVAALAAAVLLALALHR
ncbi:anthrone oxygenase family protein [Pedococcus bigeumensis]|uniref:DUF1772 domain-containing protein n=1 Tax=Pedococcus bigeumensis TaxID=433644 RepID=A0A502CLE1_9MICO|nr:anthrone oxygenase family protein [Pedococcus bigeumensis]TPG12939.1 DUF1772 domain-containing protein [Pedococcus bigeumensis]